MDPLSEDILWEIQVSHLTYSKPFLSPFLPPYSITESSHTHSTLPLSFNQALLTSITGYPLTVHLLSVDIHWNIPSSLNSFPFTPFPNQSSPHHSLTSHRVSSDSGSSVRGYPLRNSRFKFGILYTVPAYLPPHSMTEYSQTHSTQPISLPLSLSHSLPSLWDIL